MEVFKPIEGVGDRIDAGFNNPWEAGDFFKYADLDKIGELLSVFNDQVEALDVDDKCVNEQLPLFLDSVNQQITAIQGSKRECYNDISNILNIVEFGKVLPNKEQDIGFWGAVFKAKVGYASEG